jgi:signal transduction histidine kinase
LGWQWGIVSSGLALILTISAVSAEAPTPAAIAAIEALGAAAIASVAIVLTISRWRLIALGTTFVTILLVTDFSTIGWEDPIRTTALVFLGWSLSTIVGLWIWVGVPQAQRRITSIGLAHQTQHAASEREAQRRHSARLLHDTVLSTLTLLAHSGVGVSAKALKEQASGDAALLRQLRLGGSPAPSSSGSYSLEQGGISVLGTTLTAVKKKFGLLGLAVSWHGSGEVHLPLPVRDAFLLALVECLENVRRHSGVTEAHVTIIEDPATVRAIVTDPGVGFDSTEVDPSRLGFAESVVGRLRDVGGRARLFSAAGAGTTVILEVPR